MQGDIIISINGAPVASHADAAKAIKAVKTGDVVDSAEFATSRAFFEKLEKSTEK